jgi:hypothetical protein
MANNVMLGIWRAMLPVPGKVFDGQIAKSVQDTVAGLAFMSEGHHRVRDYVVTELPRAGKPLAPEVIAQGVGLPQAQVDGILDELEKRMTFLYRGDGRSVTWAYPVTSDQTPHHVTFSTGEQIHAA